MLKILRTTARRLQADKSGVTAIEYGLIMGFIAVATIVSVQAAGMEIGNVFSTISNTITEIR